MLNPDIYHSSPNIVQLLAINTDKNGVGFNNESLFFVVGGGGSKIEPFVNEKNQCLIKARGKGAVNYLLWLQSSNVLYECHGPHEWNTMGDQNGVLDCRTSRTLPSTIPSFLTHAIPSLSSVC